MQNVLPILRACVATLCLVEMACTLARLRHRDARREAGWLAALLASLAARVLVPRGSAADVLVPIAILLCTTGLVLAVNRKPGTAAAGVAAAMAAACVIAVEERTPGLAVSGPVPAAALAVLAAAPLALIALVYRKTGEPADALLVVFAGAWAAAACAETAALAAPGLSDLLVAPLALLLGFMLFEQGWLSPLTTSGYVDRLAAHRRLMRQTYARLLESRNALVLQDRLIAAGLLALGAAHEFKDVLGAVRAAARHGREAAGAGDKDACLDLVLEHAASGGAAAVAFLEHLGSDGREEPQALDARELIDRVARLARPTWRPAGVVMEVDAAPGLAVEGRRSEIEQVLLNLVRNAVEALADSGAALKTVTIRAGASNGRTAVSVIDHAGGVERGREGALFTLGDSGKGSSGVGLYLSRQLAFRNGGSLDFEGNGDGSTFTLSLPTPKSEISDLLC